MTTPLGPPRARAMPLYWGGWDEVKLAGRALPHRARVKAAIQLKFDPKSKAGSDGARSTTHGLEPQPVEIEVTCYDDEARAVLAEICVQFLPASGKSLAPVTIESPQIEHLKALAKVVILGAPSADIVAPGVTRHAIKARHWLPPGRKLATKTAQRSIGNLQQEDAARRRNPLPTAQAGAAAP